VKELILGGVRSGKSRLAEQHAMDSGLDVVYVATAKVLDEEMRQRVAHHQASRPAGWQLVEAEGDLASVLQREAAVGRCVLVDCLTLWLTQLLCESDEARLLLEVSELLRVLPGLPGKIILVSNETNMGITPMGELSRRYCDEMGRLHQQLGAICERVILTVAGLPLVVKNVGAYGITPESTNQG
jgi:adenosylcobinamide kinase/adenosylcobinamide-phosphate guanylyltransferase